MSTRSFLVKVQMTMFVVFACTLAACTSAPITNAKHVVVERIVPTANGFVVCADCEPFQPTSKRGETQVAAVKPKVDATVPVSQSLAANEQIVPARVIAQDVKSQTFKVFFKTNDARLSAQEAQRLRAFLDGIPARASLSITGYTDGTGNQVANRRLADRRANSVKDFVAGSTVSRHLSISHAEKCCPEVPDANEAERARNRHVEVTVIQ
jgi:outer membrane protein OmpA-like peptidoglycan-associated protein